ncbi:MAG: hypothetical protein AB7O65_00360 [Candidatus Korobacteraceae bacterium]
MAMQSLYELLKEKEIQLQELQRLLSDAQVVLNRVLELDAAMAGGRALARNLEPSPGSESAKTALENGWSGSGSNEFP